MNNLRALMNGVFGRAVPAEYSATRTESRRNASSEY